ncbi:MAG: iron ABC transporter permease [Deltaproteobacteria bacterium]|jgi:iron complex transport system permease protein|nr:iron ABC transporter permease [Deltaproteobacteria bacterium]
MNTRALIVLAVALVLGCLLVLPLGRHPASLGDMYQAVSGWLSGRELSDYESQILFLIFKIRLPRIVAAVLVGAALSVSGAVYQGMFLNHLVSPGILGVLAGASCGSAIGIVIYNSWLITQLLAFLGGLAGVGLSLTLAKLYTRSPILALIIGGLLSGSLFTSACSILKFLADPEQQLPQLVYWLMGTLSKARLPEITAVGPVMVIGLIFLCLSGKTVDVLSQGDDEARALGVDSRRARRYLIIAATLVCSLAVILSGIIGWIGLVMPHACRLLLGSGNRTLLPASALFGALFLVLNDTMVRLIWTVEFPLGIFTSLTCLPIFTALLWHDRRRHG